MTHNDLRVFISSRQNELERFRDLAEDVIQDSDYLTPVRFEGSGASESPKEWSIMNVLNSKFFIGIYATEISEIVEAEYEAAYKDENIILICKKEGVERSDELEEFLNNVKPYHNMVCFNDEDSFKERLQRSLEYEIKKPFLHKSSAESLILGNSSPANKSFEEQEEPGKPTIESIDSIDSEFYLNREGPQIDYATIKTENDTGGKAFGFFPGLKSFVSSQSPFLHQVRLPSNDGLSTIKRLIKSFQNNFSKDYDSSGFAIGQNNYKWVGFGSDSFINALKSRKERYMPDDISLHHTEVFFYYNLLPSREGYFFIHGQPITKTDTKEIRIKYFKTGFLTNREIYSKEKFDKTYRSIDNKPRYLTQLKNNSPIKIDIDELYIQPTEIEGTLINNKHNMVDGIICKNPFKSKEVKSEVSDYLDRRGKRASYSLFELDKVLINLSSSMLKEEYSSEISINSIDIQPMPNGHFDCNFFNIVGDPLL